MSTIVNQERKIAKPGKDKVCVFITGLSHSMQQNPEALLTLLKQHIKGACELVIPKSSHTQTNKDSSLQGFAFLYLENYKQLKPALKLKRIRIDENRTLLIKPFRKGKALHRYKKDVEKRRLFVYKIPGEVTSDSLREAFQVYGNVEDAYVILNKKDDRSKGIGNVVFDRKKDSKKALEAGRIDLGEGRFCLVKSKRNEKEGKKNQRLEGWRPDYNYNQTGPIQHQNSRPLSQSRGYWGQAHPSEAHNRGYDGHEIITRFSTEHSSFYNPQRRLNEFEGYQQDERFIERSRNPINKLSYSFPGRDTQIQGNYGSHSHQKLRMKSNYELVLEHSIKPSNSFYFTQPREELLEREFNCIENLRINQVSPKSSKNY